MKLHEVRKEYGLNQNTFYGWLREIGAIKKTDRGYVTAENCFEGMETLVTRRVNEDGEFSELTQVKIDNQKIPFLIEQYKKTGLPKLYSPSKQSTILEDTPQLDALKQRIEVLENQVLILTKQFQLIMK
ncbi:hypothetical protein [Enterococcus sp. AZ109]|uniref:hypothetical protein n=1 Tax=Enterococcus sp. AZ109 TaxID=2774634 RepID=UPI003F27D338